MTHLRDGRDVCVMRELPPVEVGAMPDLATQLVTIAGRWPPPPFWQSHVHVLHCRRGEEPLSPAPRTPDRVTDHSGTMIRIPRWPEAISCSSTGSPTTPCTGRRALYLWAGTVSGGGSRTCAVRPHGTWSAGLLDPAHNCAASRVVCDTIAAALIPSRRWVSIP